MGETIDFIRQADIKLWILTGNKIETAINIEFSYKLLDKKCKKLYILKIQLFY
jgi:magnesium-transporting ATPase (P-type)